MNHDDGLDEVLAPIADEIVDSIVRLGEQLAMLDLISEENRGTPRWNLDLGTSERVNGIEVEHPEPRLYTLDGADTKRTHQVDHGRHHAVMPPNPVSALLQANRRPTCTEVPAVPAGTSHERDLREAARAVAILQAFPVTPVVLAETERARLARGRA